MNLFRYSFFLFFVVSIKLLGQYSVPYIGKVSVDGVNFSGQAEFVFSIVNAKGSVLWRNGKNGNSTISVTVTNGRYKVLLGGQGMNPIPSDLFLKNDNLSLKVKFDNKDGKGLRNLLPDLPISSSPQARLLLGDKGIDKDLVQAYAWLNVASANGHDTAAEFRDKIELDADELVEAQSLSREIFKKTDLLKKLKSSQIQLSKSLHLQEEE